jgi:Cu(I)/Ag(I) efflux system periplasmic protein CusF
MNKALVAVFALTLAAPAFAQMKDMDMKGMDMKSDKKAGKKSHAHKASGTVEKVDAAKGTVTIAHGPVQSMNWPSMTMAFKAKDKKMLEHVKPGAKLDFDFEQRGKDYVITQIK